MAQKNALREAQEMVKVYEGMLSRANSVLKNYDAMKLELDQQALEIEKKQAALLRERHKAPKDAETYRVKLAKQMKVVHQIKAGVKVVRTTSAGAKVYGNDPLAKVQRLRRQLEKLERSIEQEEEAGTNVNEEQRQGVRAFHHDGQWFYIWEGSTKVHGPHATKEDAFTASKAQGRKS